MPEHIRSSIFVHLSKVDQNEDLVEILTSDAVIEKHVKRGNRYAIEKTVDDYYKYAYLFSNTDNIDQTQLSEVRAGSPLYKLFPVIDDRIKKMYTRSPLMFKTSGIACLNCGQRNTEVLLEQKHASDEPRIMEVICFECGHRTV